MDSQEDRSGLTRVEVALLIVITALSLSLLFPALNTRRGPTWRGTCLNNQKEIALALLYYESTHRCFPGYVNRISKNAEGEPILGSWVVSVLPYLERQDLWKLWSEGQPTEVYMKHLICPSDPPEKVKPGDPFLSYVANCGQPGDADTPAHGVFHNHDVDADPVEVNLDFISQRDGATYTLLLSENIQAGRWSDTSEANVGMVWRDQPGRCSPINQCPDAGDRPQNIQYARPSGNHPGGVVVSFCDGHQEFLREDIDYQVFQHLMTPDSRAAGVSGEFDPKQL